MSYSRLGKKGSSIVDLLVILAIFLGFAMVTVVGYKVFDDFNTEIQADDDFSNESKQVLTDNIDRYPSLFDGLFIFIFVLLFASILLSSYFLDTNPIYFIITVILLIFACIVGVMLSNVYDEFMADLTFSSYSATFPMTAWVMNNLLIVTLVIGFSVVVVLFAKNRYG